MFTGEYDHSLDPKGRLIIPARLREQLGDQFMMTKGFDGCLALYPQKEWQRIEESFQSQAMLSKEKRRFMRSFFAGAAECEVDKQGRMLIPAKLREYAGIEKEVVLIGVYTKVEIWSKERYLQETADYGDMDEFAEAMEKLGISL